MAHERKLGIGDPRRIEIVGDSLAAQSNWNFTGPFHKMTFASKMQHKIYWGILKKPLGWTLKTILAPWSYIASVTFHDSFWYPFKAKKKMKSVLNSNWGCLFRNWEKCTPNERGFSDVGKSGAKLSRAGFKVFFRSLGILWTALKEAPEFKARKRRKAGYRERKKNQ